MNPQLKRGTLELCVLALLSDRDCYGYELVNAISESIHITEGTIYPLMKRLKDEGCITSYLVESSEGPSRKYYSLTEFGKESFAADRDEYLKFANAVLALLSEDEPAG